MTVWFRWRKTRFPLLKHLDEVLDPCPDVIDIGIMQLHLFSIPVKNEFTTVVEVRAIGHDEVAELGFLFVASTDAGHCRKPRPERSKEQLEVKTCFYRAIGREP